MTSPAAKHSNVKAKSRTLPLIDTPPRKSKNSHTSSTSSLKGAFQFIRKKSEYGDVIMACARRRLLLDTGKRPTTRYSRHDTG